MTPSTLPHVHTRKTNSQPKHSYDPYPAPKKYDDKPHAYPEPHYEEVRISTLLFEVLEPTESQSRVNAQC